MIFEERLNTDSTCAERVERVERKEKLTILARGRQLVLALHLPGGLQKFCDALQTFSGRRFPLGVRWGAPSKPSEGWRARISPDEPRSAVGDPIHNVRRQTALGTRSNGLQATRLPEVMCSKIYSGGRWGNDKDKSASTCWRGSRGSSLGHRSHDLGQEPREGFGAR